MIHTFSYSAAGGQPINEDAFLLKQLSGEQGWLVALADGQSGRAGGARAAQTACRVVVERYANAARMTDAVIAADAAVAADPDAGFTTLVALVAKSDRVYGSSCGDSAAVAVCGDDAPRVLTSRQLKNPPVGSGEAAFIPFEMELTEPWRIVVMSDGVWKFASWDRVWDSAARLSGDELIDDLQAAARLRATGEFQDDFTIVVLESE